jgi:peptidoglycan/LPS O-acetylase OafA/YrhL
VLDFAIARIARLYPAFVTASVLIYLVLSAADLPGRTPSLDSLLAHFTLVPRLIGYPFVDGVFWTLQVEVVFYALVAAAALLGLRRWLMLILAVPVVIDLALKGHHCFNHFFLLGLVLYETRPAPALPPRPDRPRLTVGRFTPRHTLFLILCLVRMADPRRSGDTIALFAVAGLIWAATRYRIPALTGRALLSLGAISYSLYLVHQNIGYIIIRWGYSQGLPGPVAVLIAVLTVLILASLLTFLVERPANTLLRSWLGGSQRARPSPGITPAQTAPERPHPAG